jgi:branched-chain amino acid transport system permease protein
MNDAVSTSEPVRASGAPAQRAANNGLRGRGTQMSVQRKLLSVCGIAVLLGALVIVPHNISGYRLYLLTLIVIYALSSLGLNVLIGWCGQIGLAHAGFFGLGAYATSIMFEKGVPWFIALVLAGLGSAVAGVIVGFPAAQLRGFFLAIATLAFGELIVRILIEARDLTGGGGGYSVEPFRIGDFDKSLTTYYIALGITVLYMLLVGRVLRGRLGRTLIAVNEVEIATGALGISAAKYKLLAFGISAFTAAVAGGLLAQLLTYLSPDLFRTSLLISMLVMLIVGGVRSLWGSIIGAAFFVTIQEIFQETGEYQRLVFGLALMVTVVVLPGGLASLPRRVREGLRRRHGEAPATV